MGLPKTYRFVRERVEVNGRTVPASVDTEDREIILAAADVPDAGETGRIELGGKVYPCRGWQTADGSDYVIVQLGKDRDEPRTVAGLE